MIQRRTIVKEIAKLGYEVELHEDRENGYYYFTGDCLDKARGTSVYVYRLNHLPLERWIQEFQAMRAEHEAFEADISLYAESNKRILRK